MVKFNWVGYNKKTGIYYIRSYHYVLRLIDAKSNVRVNYNLTDLNRKKIRALTGAALFGYFAYLQLIKLRYRRQKRSRMFPYTKWDVRHKEQNFLLFTKSLIE